MHFVLVIMFSFLGLFSNGKIEAFHTWLNQSNFGESFKSDHKPYFAQVIIAWHYYCGGTIISDRAVLTAAQCLFTTILTDYRIYVGVKEYMNGDEFMVLNSIVHPDYNAYTHAHDIGILITVELMKFQNNKIEPLPISSEKTEMEEGANVLIMGFQLKKLGWVYDSRELVRTTVQVMSRVRCKETFNKLFPISVLLTDTQFCTVAGPGKLDLCHRENGGPAVYKNKLVGIVSWGLGCGIERYPRVYTYVPRYHNWIVKNMVPTEMINACTGSSHMTQFYTIILIHRRTARCACTILSKRWCLTVSNCITNDDNIHEYSLFHHNTYYQIESFKTGQEMDTKWTVKGYDLLIINSEYIYFEEHYGPPAVLSDDTNINKYSNGLLIKNHYFGGVSAIQIYAQNEKVFIIDSMICNVTYGNVLPFQLTTNHFCIYNDCDPAETKRQICADLEGSVVFNNLDELIGLIVWQERCHTLKMAVGVYLTKYLNQLKKSNRDMFEE